MTSTGKLLTTAIAIAACMAGLRPAPASAETDFGQVAMYVSNMLEDHHYSRRALDDKLSRDLLENYLEFLDYNHLFFTRGDIEGFRKKFGNRLDDDLLVGDISAARDVYKVYEKRVRDRIAKIGKILKDEKFSYERTDEILLSRKDAPWPADMAAADDLWRKRIEGEMLQERLKASSKKGETSKKGEDPPDARDRISKRYQRFIQSLDENDDEDIANFFVSSLSQAYDPHSEYFSHSELDNFKTGMRHWLHGIGALLESVDGICTVKGIVVKGPADRNGRLKVGDKITGVGQDREGEIVDVQHLKLQKVVDMIRGKKGSTVRLEVQPADSSDPSKRVVIAIARDKVQLKDRLANAELIEVKNGASGRAKIGWINLYSFYADLDKRTTSTTKDVKRLLQRLVDEDIKGLVLDLRGNGGGSLEEAINLTGLFIPRGPVVQSKDWRQNTRVSRSPGRYPIYEGPLIVLTDRVSASASEILAAALQDYNRALIVGEKSTFGKGTVQTILPVEQFMPIFSNKDRAGALKVTIQKFYRIAGGSTQLRGVIPDVILPSRRDPIDIGEAALKNALKYDEIRKEKYKLSSTGLPVEELKRLSSQRIKTDPEFQYVVKDIARLQGQIERNKVSLNEAKRRAENEADEQRRKKRTDERKQRLAAIEKNADSEYKVYRLTLDNVEEKDLPLKSSMSDTENSGMILAKDDEADEEDEVLRFPYDIGPEKLEAINILQDLIRIGNNTASTASTSSKRS